MCSVRLKAALPLWLDYYKPDNLTVETKEKAADGQPAVTSGAGTYVHFFWVAWGCVEVDKAKLDAAAYTIKDFESKTGPCPETLPVLDTTSKSLLNETQALALVRGSCIYAGCHADAATVMASPNILVEVKDSLMPPPTQQRYTLRSADRAALVAYLEDRNPAALVD